MILGRKEDGHKSSVEGRADGPGRRDTATSLRSVELTTVPESERTRSDSIASSIHADIATVRPRRLTTRTRRGAVYERHGRSTSLTDGSLIIIKQGRQKLGARSVGGGLPDDEDEFALAESNDYIIPDTVSHTEFIKDETSGQTQLRR